MPAQKITDAERQFVRNFLVSLGEAHGGWEKLAQRAGVKFTTGQAWRYGERPTIPSVLNFLRILRAADALRDEAVEFLQQAQRDADEAARQASELEPPAPGNQAQDG